MANEIQSVVRSFSIIEHLSGSAKSQPLKSIAAACNLPPPTAHRLLNTLCSLNYVIHENNGYYKISNKLFEMSSKQISNNSLVSIAKPHLDELSERLGESVHLVVRNGNDIIYVYKITQTIGSVQMASRIGMRLPMYCCAVGKAILATMSDNEIAEVFNTSDIVAITKNTITDLDRLMDQVHIIRQVDYAIDNEENEEGVKCVATSIGNSHDDTKDYAFSISSLKPRMSDHRIREIVEAMHSTKRQIERELFL